MKRTTKSLIFLQFILLIFLHEAHSQQEITYKSNPVTLSQYLAGVRKGNLGYIAGRFNVSIAEAELNASKALPDPEVSLVYSNNQDWVLRMGQSYETVIGYPVNLGNKRKSGISLARSQFELSRLVLDTYFQNLRADATISYFACLRNQRIYLLQKEIHDQLSGFAAADSIRHKTGDGTGIDAMQSSLEAKTQLIEVYQSFADMQNASLNLMYLQGKTLSDTLDNPSDDFPCKKSHFSLEKLVENAIINRSDLLVAIKNKEISENYLRLLKANRAFEFNVEAGYSYNAIVKNEIAPAPAFNGLSAGISFPLKISGFNKESLKAAEFAIEQSHAYYEETVHQITSEVFQAFNNYVALKKRVDYFQPGLIEDAGRILQGRILSFRNGETGLVDVLNARRTYTELQLSHIHALYEYTVALIELERAAGIWDLSP
jgi:cobalt-zinc-cadmium efflux system outer membrane protein